jgi:nucleoside-diphosphate-sugar epimerase
MAEDDGRIVSNLVSQALRGHPLTVYGDGRQTRSLCHVDDMVRGLLALMAAGDDGAGAGPVNLGNPEEVTVLDLARRVLAATAPPRGSASCRCRRTTRAAAGPTSPRGGAARLAARACRSRRGCGARSRTSGAGCPTGRRRHRPAPPPAGGTARRAARCSGVPAATGAA